MTIRVSETMAGLVVASLFGTSISTAAFGRTDLSGEEKSQDQIYAAELEMENESEPNSVVIEQEESGAIVVLDQEEEELRFDVDPGWTGVKVYFNKAETATLADLGIQGAVFRCAIAFKVPQVAAVCALIVGAGGVLAKHALSTAGCVGGEVKYIGGVPRPFIHRGKKCK
jgi:hypothetical protein